MEQDWKSINGFMVRFTSSFDQLKIQFFTEIKTNRKRHPWKLSITIHLCWRLPRWSSGYKLLVPTDSDSPSSNPLAALKEDEKANPLWTNDFKV